MTKIQLPKKSGSYRNRMNIFRSYDFSGGLNTATEASLLEDNESPDCLNCHSNETGALIKRSGYTKYNSTTLGTGGMQGGAKYYTVNGTEHMLAAHGGKVYSDTALNGTFTEKKTGMNSSNDFDFVQGLVSGSEVMVISDRTNNLQKYDGSSVSQLTAKAGMFPIVHKERLFVVDPSDKATVYASYTGDITDFSTDDGSGSSTYTLTAGKGDGDIIKWLAEVNDSLAILKRKRIGILYTGKHATDWELEWAPGGIGCTSSRGVGKNRGSLFFPSDDGVYKFDGSLVEKISDKIDNTYNNIGDVTTIVGECFDGKYYMAYTPSGGSSNTEVLVYDISEESWWKYDGMDISDWILWDKGDDIFELYGCDASDGFIYKMFNGDNDAGSAIDFYWKSKWQDFGRPERKKRFRRVYAQFEKTTEDVDVAFGYTYDYNNAYETQTINTQGSSATLGPTGNFTLGTDVLGSGGEKTGRLPVSGQHRWLQYKIANNAIDNPVTYKGSSTYWRLRGPV